MTFNENFGMILNIKLTHCILLKSPWNQNGQFLCFYRMLLC